MPKELDRSGFFSVPLPWPGLAGDTRLTVPAEFPGRNQTTTQAPWMPPCPDSLPFVFSCFLGERLLLRSLMAN